MKNEKGQALRNGLIAYNYVKQKEPQKIKVNVAYLLQCFPTNVIH